MKTEILRYLQQTDGFVSGQELCRQFGVSRTAVWKAIRRLEEEGYVIEAVRNRGYRLLEIPDILTAESCRSRIDTVWAGQKLEAYDEIESTNRRARQLGEEGAPHGSLVIAEHQNAGRGRRGRSWTASPGEALMFSLLLRPVCPPECASMLTMVAALAVSRALDEAAGIHTEIKWPNDIVYEKKKLCGILTEMSTELDQIHYVVVGIGVNVHEKEFPGELSETAISLYMATGRRYERSRILGGILRYFEEYYDIFIKTSDLSDLKEQYESKLAGRDGRIAVLGPEGARQGICRGVTASGALVVEYEDGSVERIISGEVSVRGIYGYI